jgi:hypothetical protein
MKLKNQINVSAVKYWIYVLITIIMLKFIINLNQLVILYALGTII